MPSDKNTRRQRHQAQVKTQPGKAIRGAQSTEFVKKAGYRKSEFIGGKKYYTPMSTDPTSSGAGGDVTNVTISGSSGVAAVDNIGVYNVTTVAPVLGGHVTPITGSGVISIQDYDPIGAAASGLSAKGVISSDTVYDGDSPGTFATHFLRKDGVWADVSASLNAFVTWSWVPQSGTPFTTVADSSADAITVTAGAGLEFTDTSDGATDALTFSSTVPNLTVNGAGTVHANNYTDTNTWRGIDDTPVDGQTAESISSNWAYDHDADASAHHTKYTDTNATSAMGSKGDSNPYHHDKYTNSNATSAMGSKGNSNAFHHDRYTDSEAVAAQPDYDPVGGVHSGVVQTSDTYSGGNPSANNFISYFLRKDGGWANPLGSVLAFKTLSFVPSGGGTPFTTIADATDDTLTVTAGTGIQVALTAADHVTITSTVTDTNTQCGGDGHARYADSEAVAAVNATSSITTTCDSPDVNHNTDVNWNCSSISGSAGTARTTLGIDTNDAVTFGALTCSTINTGQGATEVYLMNQHVKTDSDVRFDSFGVGTNASSTTGEIRATNEVTAYYSDDRLKNRYGNIEDALKKVCSLNGFHYQPNEVAGQLGYDTSQKKVGVSAQEVLKVLPEAVTEAPIDPQYHAVQYDKLVPLLVEAVKELSERKCSCGV